MKKQLLLLLSTFAFVVGEETSSITLSITGWRSQKGDALVSLYRTKESFLKKAYKEMSLSLADTVTTIIPNLPHGEYAVSVLHDENSNGKLEQWFFVGPPKEGVGVSGNSEGMPSFEKSKVMLKGDLTLPISIQYIGAK